MLPDKKGGKALDLLFSSSTQFLQEYFDKTKITAPMNKAGQKSQKSQNVLILVRRIKNSVPPSWDKSPLFPFWALKTS